MMKKPDEIRHASAAPEAEPAFTDDQFVHYFNSHIPGGLALVNATCIGASQEAGQIRMAFDLDERFINVVGFICGGYIAQILDQTATGAGSVVTGRASPSLDLKVSFIAPARPGRFTATGSVIKAGGSIAFLEAKMFDESDTLIATGAVTAQLVSFAKLAQRA